MLYSLFSLITLGALASTAQPICVQTFNTYGPFYAPYKSARTEETLRLLQREGACDAYLFQEAWIESHSQRLEQGLGRLFPGVRTYQFDELRRDDKKSGITLSTSDVEFRSGSRLFGWNQDSLLDQLRKTLSVEKGFGYVEVLRPEQGEGAGILWISLHLHPSSQRVRLSQILELGEFLLSETDLTHPFVVAGDFNAEPGSLESSVLREVFQLSDAYLQKNGGYPPRYCTYCGDNPLSWSPGKNKVLDYIYYRSGAKVQLWPEDVRTNLIASPDRTVSDHAGVRARFNVRIEPAQSSSQDRVRTLQAQAQRVLAEVVRVYLGDAKLEEPEREAMRRVRGLESRIRELRVGDPLTSLYLRVESGP
jgi:hypothetical protein